MDARSYIIVGCFALLALIVFIDGLLQGELLRALCGFVVLAGMVALIFRLHHYIARFNEKLADAMAGATEGVGTRRNWLVAIVSFLFCATCLAGAATSLFASFDYLLAWEGRKHGFVAGLNAVGGEIGARLVLIALFLACAWFSGLTFRKSLFPPDAKPDA